MAHLQRNFRNISSAKWIDASDASLLNSIFCNKQTEKTILIFRMSNFGFLFLLIVSGVNAMSNAATNDSSTNKEKPPVLIPVILIDEDKNHQLNNHTTQLSVPVTLNNGTVVVAGQEIEPEDPTNINVLVPLQLYSPDGDMLSSATVTTEARAIVLETRRNGIHVLRLQLLVTSVESQEVIVVSIPEVRLFLSDDGNERQRSVSLLKPERSALLSNGDTINTELDEEILAFTSITEKNVPQESVMFKPQDVSLEQKEVKKNMNQGGSNMLCRGGCSANGNCLRPELLLCVQLPPAMRLAICAVLLCLAAFLLMLFVHVFVVRPSSRSLYRPSSLYTRNMRVAWAYSPLYDKEACA